MTFDQLSTGMEIVVVGMFALMFCMLMYVIGIALYCLFLWCIQMFLKRAEK